MKKKNILLRFFSKNDLRKQFLFSILILLLFFFQNSVQNQFITKGNADLLNKNLTINPPLEQLNWVVEFQNPNGKTQFIKKDSPNQGIYPESASSLHPLMKDNTNVVPLDEIMLLSVDDSDLEDLNGWLYDDALSPHSFTELHHWDEGDNSANPNVAAGDFDGDTKDEIVFLSTDNDDDDLNGWVWDDVNALVPFKNMKYWDANDDTSNPQIATGDIDGDGRDEIIFAGTDNDNDDLNAWAFDDALNSIEPFAELYHWNANDNLKEVDVCTGDADGDGCDEIIFTGVTGSGVVYKIFDDANHDFALLKQKTYSDGYLSTQVASGDIDGDKLDEFIIVGATTYDGDIIGNKGLFVYIIGDVSNNFNMIDSWSNPASTCKPYVASGDFDGDYFDEIAIVTGGWNGYDVKAWFYDDETTDFAFIRNWVEPGYHPNLALGEINLDGLCEVIVVCADASDAEDNNGYVLENITGTFSWTHPIDHNDGSDLPCVVCGDFDGDGIHIQYTGNSWESTTQPIPVVVMACAPLIRHISQNYVMSGTTFGYDEHEGIQESKEVGSSISAAISYESGDPFGALKVSMSATLSDEFSRTHTNSSMVTYGMVHVNGYPDDSIIFQKVTYKHYLYTITSHIDSLMIGQNITLDIPDNVSVIKTSIDYFNIFYNTAHLNINVFNHTAGDVRTYPSADQKNALITQYHGLASDLATVGQGNGYTTAILNLAEEVSTSEMNQTGYSMQMGLSLGGIGFTGSYGWSEGDMYSIITGASTSYDGSVGDIADPEEYNTYKYDFGLFVYNYKPNPNIAYQVINYWVENAPVQDPPIINLSDLPYLILIFGALAAMFIYMNKKGVFKKNPRNPIIEPDKEVTDQNQTQKTSESNELLDENQNTEKSKKESSDEKQEQESNKKKHKKRIKRIDDDT